MFIAMCFEIAMSIICYKYIVLLSLYVCSICVSAFNVYSILAITLNKVNIIVWCFICCNLRALYSFWIRFLKNAGYNIINYCIMFVVICALCDSFSIRFLNTINYCIMFVVIFALCICFDYCCRAPTRQHTILDVLTFLHSGFFRVHSTQSFARPMYCRRSRLVSVHFSRGNN
jgi:hypothetical protein